MLQELNFLGMNVFSAIYFFLVAYFLLGFVFCTLLYCLRGFKNAALYPTQKVIIWLTISAIICSIDGLLSSVLFTNVPNDFLAFWRTEERSSTNQYCGRAYSKRFQLRYRQSRILQALSEIIWCLWSCWINQSIMISHVRCQLFHVHKLGPPHLSNRNTC